MIFSIIAFLGKDYANFFLVFCPTILLAILFLVFGGLKRIRIFFKVRDLMKKIPRGASVVGYKETAALLGFSIEYLQNLNLSFAGPSTVPKAAARDISFQNKTSFTRYEIRQLAYYKFSDIELTQSKTSRTDYME